MNITARIEKYDGQHLLVTAPFPDVDKLRRQRVRECEVIFSDGRRITPLQRRYIYAMLRDIGLYTGHEVEYLKDYFKADYVAKTGGKWFSLADCSMTQANELIELVIQFCVEWHIPTQDNLAVFAPSLDRYLYWCLKNKVCCVTRSKRVELHHVDAVGMGRNRKDIVHLGMRVMPLTRKLHSEAHTIGQRAFNEKYHVYGIPLDETLCKVYGVKYQ